MAGVAGRLESTSSIFVALCTEAVVSYNLLTGGSGTGITLHWVTDVEITKNSLPGMTLNLTRSTIGGVRGEGNYFREIVSR